MALMRNSRPYRARPRQLGSPERGRNDCRSEVSRVSQRHAADCLTPTSILSMPAHSGKV
jgi:hypothetical protein